MRAGLALALAPLLIAAGCLSAPEGEKPQPSATDTNRSPPGGVSGGGSAPPATNGTPPVRPPPLPCPTGDCPGQAPPRGRVVAAVIDTGINPYHADFSGQRPLAPEATPFPLTRAASHAEAVEADRARWDALEVGKLYAFPGTRIVGAVSMGQLGTATAPSTSVILDDVGHGTASASALVRNAPDVDIVVVQVGSASLTDGIAWAAAQPWIDVVSVSWGTVGNVPLVADVVEATRQATQAGKLVVVAAGNEPTAAPLGMSGPTWVVSVGGSSPDGKGETWAAAKGVDVVSDFSPVVARHDDLAATEEQFGTSFATPTVAGALAQAWWLARQSDASVTSSQLREAMNRVAAHFTPTDYRPNTLEVPVLVPCLQQGWGYVDGSMAQSIFLTATGAQQPAGKGPAVEACMDAVHAARATWWG